MFKALSITHRAWSMCILLVAILTACLVWQTRLIKQSDRRSHERREPAASVFEVHNEPADALPHKEEFAGEQARTYLEHTSEGQSLMQAVTAERFRLKLEERDPFSGKSGAGYLGMSHDQNLNAWFDETGATIRPTAPEPSWKLGFQLRAYGYEERLIEAPPIVSREVKGSRIEYGRNADFGMQTSDYGLLKSDISLNPQSAIRTPQLVEWYENRSEGIEQGFTIIERPTRSSEVAAAEPLRVSLGVTGDLRASVKDKGQRIDLVDAQGKSAVSYSKLTAVDANQKQLAARMQASADGRTIVLLIDDRTAAYPIVIDPIVASLEEKLDGYTPRAEARFGFAVAIDGDHAVVGAWRDNADNGRVYFFNRTGSTWSNFVVTFSGNDPGGRCGYSVAISSVSYGTAVYGCPGANNERGRAFFYPLDASAPIELFPSTGSPKPGYLYGQSVAISHNRIVVGAPLQDTGGGVRTGLVNTFDFNSNSTIVSSYGFLDPQPQSNAEFGANVAISADNTIVVGAPGHAGKGKAVLFSGTDQNFLAYLLASDGGSGDNFGNSVDINGNTVVVGAWGDDDVATDSGAAYVFTRAANGVWSQQQKLRADDGRQDDHFSEHAVAIESNTIVVGATSWDLAVSGDNAGAVYVFTRSGTVWTRQTALFGDAAQNFGIGIDFSGNSVLVGARFADAGGIPRTGAAYAYRLDCTAPANSRAQASVNDYFPSVNICPGGGLGMYAVTSNFGNASLSYQWRRNGLPIAGATTSPYVLNSAKASDAGSYDVVISNSCGVEASIPFSLIVETFSLSPTMGNYGAAGSDGNISVTSTASCPYTAVPSASWIKITSNGSGDAPKNVGFHVDPNTGPSQRTGTITIRDKTFTVTQDGLNCSYSIAPTAQSFGANGGTNSVSVTTLAGCAWTATSNAGFINITSGASGAGNGTVGYSVAANDTINQRTGTITIAGQTFTVTQAGLSCNYSIAPSSQGFTATGGTNTVSVTVAGGCGWTALSNSPFITINSGSSGNGSGTVNYTVAANTGSARSGTIAIAGQTFTVNQAAPMWEPVVLTTDQVELKTWTLQGRTYSYVKLLFPNAGYRVPNWGQPVNAGSNVSADALVEKFNGPSVLAVTTTAQIYDLGPLINGNYTFTFRNSGTAVKSLAFSVSPTVPPPNPIDNARELVRQQYRDFLNREADQAGEDFWTDNITKCSDPARRPAGQTEAQCTTRQRETTSGAFFQSPEFQYTGYYVYRMYQGALGRRPKLSEFTPDALFVGNGIIVNGQLSAAKINQNKAAFAAQFVNCLDPARYRCSEFKSTYDGLSNQQYVDQLFQTTGVNANASDRASLINGLNGGTETRATVLQKVVDGINVISEGNQQFTTTYGQTFYNNEFNRAFVELEYFGYMKRDPDDGGYTFWLAKLNQFGGNFVNAEMVLAFISSPEYRARFGQP